jgi:hypothetical protein
MPAIRTRSSSQQRSRHEAERYISPTRNLPSRPTPKLNVPEVIVLSSDGENARPSDIGSSRSKKNTIKKPKFPMREVLEISSSDEGPVQPKAPANDGSWQRENSKLKQVRLPLSEFQFPTDGGPLDKRAFREGGRPPTCAT